MSNWLRICPKCYKELTYSSYKNLWRANKYNSLCIGCTPFKYKGIVSNYGRSCPKCEILINYKTKSAANRATRIDSLCSRCAQILPSTGRQHSPETKQKIKNNHAKPWKDTMGFWNGKKHSEETKNKIRESHANRIKSLFGSARYNKSACNIFNAINKKLNWCGQHAENGGEFHIQKLGYWVDYYEPTLNLVIEYDERLHDKRSIKKKDAERQERIVNFLQCKFERIRFDDNIPEKIHNLEVLYGAK